MDSAYDELCFAYITGQLEFEEFKQKVKELPQ